MDETYRVIKIPSTGFSGEVIACGLTYDEATAKARGYQVETNKFYYIVEREDTSDSNSNNPASCAE